MRIRLETEAKLYIQANIRAGLYSLCWSYINDWENTANPYEDRKKSIAPWKTIADTFCPPANDIVSTGRELMGYGIKAKDALHIACAIKSGCDYVITTDEKLINKNITAIKIVNPIDFVREMESIS
jgi:predicted nucleic acid-binding protein